MGQKDAYMSMKAKNIWELKKWKMRNNYKCYISLQHGKGNKRATKSNKDM